MKKKGQFTFPIDTSIPEESRRIMGEWGADAIRDCDGTELPKDLDLDVKVYSTYFVTRGDNEWARAHMDELQHFYLMSRPHLATGDTVNIKLLDGFFEEQVRVDSDSDPARYWEVIDRTAGEVVPVTRWTYSATEGVVTVRKAVPMHEYTATFFAYTVWDSTQMYNYITNDWTREKQFPYDPRYPATNRYIKEHLRAWLAEHPDTDVVRFTTFLYHFMLLFNADKKEKYVDWFGYTASCSPRAMDDFEREYGYRLRPEDIVDAGYYNSPFRVPTKQYRDYMQFVSRFVCGEVKQLVDIVHEAGKEAMMFLGDTWIGAEPYGEYFESLGLDAVVGSVGSGVTVRMLTDIPGIRYAEGRFLPYFFPDTFCEGGQPVKELNKIWIQARRAMLRKPLDRIGFGGYLNLAAKFPDFIDRVTDMADEYRDLYARVKGKKPYTLLKVAVLNSWGKLRSWQAYMVAHELWYKQIYSYLGISEALSGMPVEVCFLSFDDIRRGGVPKDVDVMINAGLAGTAYSGGDEWRDASLAACIKAWVHAGGGFIGIGEPTACDFGGRYFQLSSVLGVDEERGFSLSADKYNIAAHRDHFILQDCTEPLNFGEGTKNVYALPGATVLDIDLARDLTRDVNVGEVRMAVNEFGKGRAFYMAGLPYSTQNARILLRAMCYTAHREEKLKSNYSTNPYTEYNYYPESGEACVVNSSTEPQETILYDKDGKKETVRLAPMEILWK